MKFKKVTNLSRSQVIIIAFVFGVTAGVVLVLSGFAFAPDVPTGANDIVLEQHLGTARFVKAGSFDFDPVKFRLYGDGTAICGSGKDLSPTKQYSIKTVKLTRPRIAALVTKLRSAGFLNLKKEYFGKSKLSIDENTILLNVLTGAKSVSHYGGAKPKAFADTEKEIAKLCGGAKVDYKPAAIKLTTVRTLKDGASGIKLNKWNLRGLKFPKRYNGSVSAKFSGTRARAILDLFRGSTHSYFIEQDGIYLARIVPELPLPNPLKKSLSLVEPAHAATENNVQFIAVRASNQSVIRITAADVANYRSSIRQWYEGETDKYFGLGDDLVRQGSKTISGYRTCPQGYSCGNDEWKTMRAIHYNLAIEFAKAGTARILLAQFGDGNDWCAGLGDVGGGSPTATVINMHDVCVGTHEANYVIPAHELGHNFGLDHTSDDTLMNDQSETCFGNWPANCNLNSRQATGLKNDSPYFNEPGPPPDTTAPPTPGGLREGSKTASSVTIAWNSVSASDLGGYYVYRDGTSVSNRVCDTSSTSCVSEGLSPDTNYSFRVSSYDSPSGNESAKSAEVTVRTQAVPPDGGGGGLDEGDTSSGDSYVDELTPTYNYGRSTDLTIAAAPTANKYAYLRFPAITGGTVNKALLRLYFLAPEGASTALTISYDVMRNNWNEICPLSTNTNKPTENVECGDQAISWGHQPTQLALNLGTQDLLLRGEGWQSIDITGAAQAYRNGFTLRLKVSGAAGIATFRSRDSVTNQPHLLLGFSQSRTLFPLADAYTDVNTAEFNYGHSPVLVADTKLHTVCNLADYPCQNEEYGTTKYIWAKFDNIGTVRPSQGVQGRLWMYVQNTGTSLLNYFFAKAFSDVSWNEKCPTAVTPPPADVLPDTQNGLDTKNPFDPTTTPVNCGTRAISWRNQPKGEGTSLVATDELAGVEIHGGNLGTFQNGWVAVDLTEGLASFNGRSVTIRINPLVGPMIITSKEPYEIGGVDRRMYLEVFN